MYAVPAPFVQAKLASRERRAGARRLFVRVGQPFQADVRLESLTYVALPLAARHCLGELASFSTRRLGRRRFNIKRQRALR
jgi:hypothetical protein